MTFSSTPKIKHYIFLSPLRVNLAESVSLLASERTISPKAMLKDGRNNQSFNENIHMSSALWPDIDNGGTHTHICDIYTCAHTYTHTYIYMPPVSISVWPLSQS